MKVFLNTKFCEAGTLSLCSTEGTETQIRWVTCPAAEPSESKPTWFSYLHNVFLLQLACYTHVLPWWSTQILSYSGLRLPIVWLNAVHICASVSQSVKNGDNNCTKFTELLWRLNEFLQSKPSNNVWHHSMGVCYYYHHMFEKNGFQSHLLPFHL